MAAPDQIPGQEFEYVLPRCFFSWIELGSGLSPAALRQIISDLDGPGDDPAMTALFFAERARSWLV